MPSLSCSPMQRSKRIPFSRRIKPLLLVILLASERKANIRDGCLRRTTETQRLLVVAQSRNSLWLILQAVPEEINGGGLVKDGRVNYVPVFHNYSQNPHVGPVHDLFPILKTRIR